ncbi:hypothetical protein [Streptomyces sp. CC224B]|uniref:hypothetical protein n=1 Tax=Streptomyces sp. CC224B TaxID=3044571 RepID=UPI0024A9E143|nr:hypothetical protein [Streptomyces sp. CC224B]
MIQIRLLGGPEDGRTLTIPDDEPPSMYLIPITPPLSDLWIGPLVAKPTQTSEYEPLCTPDWEHRRAGDGAYLYRYRVPPVSAADRQALEEARRAAKAAEEEREAMLDAAWQDIRRERPHYPADRREFLRNLFKEPPRRQDP